MTEMKKPAEWAKDYGITIADPDGWRSPHAKNFDLPLDEQEFRQRLGGCTLGFHDMEKFRAASTRRLEGV
jgi:hypothetical protein